MDLPKATGPLPALFQFGLPRVEIMALVLMSILFTGIAVALFLFLTRDNSIRRDVQAAFGKGLPRVSKLKAAIFVLPPWIFAIGWFYNDTLGSKFFSLEREAVGNRVTWNLVYAFPKRVRPLPDDEIQKWTGAIDWSRRSMKHALVVEMKNGALFQSCGIHPKSFEDVVAQMKLVGIDVPLKPDPKANVATNSVAK